MKNSHVQMISKKADLADIISENEMNQHCVIIRRNCVAGIITLLKIFLSSKNKQFEQLCLNDNISTVINAIKIIIEYGNKPYISAYNFASKKKKDYTEIGDAINTVWGNISYLRQIYAETNILYPENMEYFFDNIKTIMSMEYYPSYEDVLKVCEKTIGVHTYSYLVQNRNYSIHIKDMSGERFDRHCWIYEFGQKWHGVIFVAALSDFNKHSLTDASQNAMQESIQLFSQLINGKWFRGMDTKIILLLNKDDIFRKLLRRGFSLSKCFREWDGPDYDTKHEEKMIEFDHYSNDYFEYCYEKSLKYIQDQFTFCCNDNSRVIFTHVTNALDVQLVEKLFWDIQNIVYIF
eukprot:152106_1